MRSIIVATCVVLSSCQPVKEQFGSIVDLSGFSSSDDRVGQRLPRGSSCDEHGAMCRLENEAYVCQENDCDGEHEDGL